MPTPQYWKISTWEDVPITVFDLVKGVSGSNVTIASLSSLTMKAFNPDTLEQIGATTTLTIATTIFDTVQTSANDPRYTGTNGYNFRATFPGTFFPTGNQIVMVEVYFTDTSGNVFPDVWEVTVKEVIGT